MVAFRTSTIPHTYPMTTRKLLLLCFVSLCFINANEMLNITDRKNQKIKKKASLLPSKQMAKHIVTISWGFQWLSFFGWRFSRSIIVMWEQESEHNFFQSVNQITFPILFNSAKNTFLSQRIVADCKLHTSYNFSTLKSNQTPLLLLTSTIGTIPGQKPQVYCTRRKQ